nr:MAG TPA: TEP1 N-terminal domain [Caudoviricetes sp.]
MFVKVFFIPIKWVISTHFKILSKENRSLVWE